MSKRVQPFPPPRYDEVFFDGVAWLDSLAGEPLSIPTELEALQDRLRAAEVVIMALFHRIDNLEAILKQQNAMLTFEQRELKYEPEGLRLVIKDVQTWD